MNIHLWFIIFMKKIIIYILFKKKKNKKNIGIKNILEIKCSSTLKIVGGKMSSINLI